jgi:tetratricopeptide (TPR) repeat protein
MRRKKSVLVLLIILLVVGINYVLMTNRPLTEIINVKDYLLGIDLISFAIIFTIVEKIIAKILSRFVFKSNFPYKPKAFWVISLSFILSGLLIICIYLFEEYVPVYKLNYFYINLVFQLFISLIASAIVYEIYNFCSSFSLKVSLLLIKLADKLFYMNKVELALGVYSRLSKNTTLYNIPVVYAKIKLGMSKCYYELSKKSSKRSFLQKAIKELEGISKIRSLGKHLGIIKTNLGDLYCEYYEIDEKTNHLITSLSLYENAIDYFNKDENFEIYMEISNKADKIKTRLSALRFS